MTDPLATYMPLIRSSPFGNSLPSRVNERRPNRVASVRLRFCPVGAEMEDDVQRAIAEIGPHTKEKWLKRMEEVELYECDLHSTLMNYFVINRYVDVAEEFSKEACVKPEMPIECIGRRKSLQEAVLRGDMQEAIDLMNAIDPQILPSNPEINFLLKHQQLLQLIKKGETEQAIEFAQQQLAPCVKQNSELLPKLEEAMSLLAFSDLKCPAAQRVLLGMDELEKTATKIDEVVLDFYGVDPESVLEHMCKNVLWTQQQLKSLHSNNMKTQESCSVPVLSSISKGAMESAVVTATADHNDSGGLDEALDEGIGGRRVPPPAISLDIDWSRYRGVREYRWTEREQNLLLPLTPMSITGRNSGDDVNFSDLVRFNLAPTTNSANTTNTANANTVNMSAAPSPTNTQAHRV